MYKRDLMKAEIERLALVLAKIMGLKVEQKFEESQRLFDDTMKGSFDLPAEIVTGIAIEPFKEWLEESSLSAAKLDSLSEFLFYELGTSPQRNAVIAPKLNLIYQVLAEKHKLVHLVNFHRQEIIQQYL
ncbi:hypothetical protein D9M68_566600 [compost metagenome]